MKTPSPSTSRRILAGLAVLVGTLAVLEVVLRLWIVSPSATVPDPQFEYFQRAYSWQVFSKEGYCRTRMNRFGLNDDDPLPRKPPLRALVVGDSYTEAMQVDPSKNFGSVAESMVEGLEICNGGRSGWGPPDLAAFAELRGGQFDPDVLVVQYNDLDLREFTRPAEIHLRRDGTSYELVIPGAPAQRKGVHRIGSWMKQHSALFTQVERRLDVLTRTERERLKRHFFPPPARAAENPDVTFPPDAVEMLLYLHQRLARRYSKIIYLYIPRIHYSQIEGGGLYTPQHREVYHEFARRAGVTLIDPTDSLLAEYRRSAQPCHGFQNSVMGKGHLNVRGHRIVGRMLAEELRKFLP